MASNLTQLPANTKPIITNYTDSKLGIYQTKIPASSANNPLTLASNWYSVRLPQREATVLSAKLSYGWTIPCFAGGYQNVGSTQNVDLDFYPKFGVFDQNGNYTEYEPVIDADNTPYNQTVAVSIAANNFNAKGYYELDFAQYAAYDFVNNVKVKSCAELFRDNLVKFGAFVYHDNSNATVGNLYIEISSNFICSYSYMN